MSARRKDTWLAGVDGCRKGWIVAFLRPDGTDARIQLVPHFAEIVAAPEAPSIIAIDIPIGLPERAGVGGRAAENQIRPLLGKLQRRYSPYVHAQPYARTITANADELP
jgi:predicted RNase H-like nuclease